MSLLLSSDDRAVIERRVLNEEEDDRFEDVDFDLNADEVAAWARNLGLVSRLLLQFPDALLRVAPRMASAIASRLDDVDVAVLGDATFSSCCVDRIAAKHLPLDRGVAIVHFGHSCLSHDGEERVLNVQVTKKSTNFALAEDLKDAKRILLFTKSKSDFPSNVFVCQEDAESGFFSRRLPDDGVQSEDVFINDGYSERFSTLLAMSKPLNRHFRVSVDRKSLAQVEAKRELLRRRVLVEKLRDARRLGLLVGGALATDGCNEALRHLSALIRRSGRRSYTFLVGKPNSPKLANFPEIDVFVLVACPETSLVTLAEQADFLQPIVTPFEVEVAFNPARDEWNPLVDGLPLDFRYILPGRAGYREYEEPSSSIEADVSLVTGKIRTLNGIESASNHSTDVATRSTQVAELHSGDGAGQFLANRSWRGLDRRVGETPVEDAVRGQSGIASHYRGEGEMK